MSLALSRNDKILVVDDDARIRDLLRRYLTQEGFEVILAEDGKSLNRIMLRESADLIVLDLMMPGEDGLSICRRLRAANDRTPIIMLTAKGEDVDRIVGLEVGADDYLGKPFNPRELLARVHAVLRRRPAHEAPGAPSSENEVVAFGPFTFDLGARTLRKNGGELPLTTGEFAMLKALVRHPRQPLSRGDEFPANHSAKHTAPPLPASPIRGWGA
jgi:two-component system phosphate regulon response regulator OmpR